MLTWPLQGAGSTNSTMHAVCDAHSDVKCLLHAGMMLGAFAVGAHMAMTHAICLSMMAAYIPATEVPGLGRVSGTVWSFTDFVLGKLLLHNSYTLSMCTMVVNDGSLHVSH